MNSKFKRIRKITKNENIFFTIYFVSRYIKLYLIELISKIFALLIGFIQKIDIPCSTRFIGLPIFSKYELSKIHFGPSCVLISSKNSFVNPAGINRRCFISTMSEGAEIIIGKECGFSGTIISSKKSIIIGNNVNMGANTTIYDHDFHSISGGEYKNEPQSVIIEDEVWLGLNVIVLKGVKIGKGAIVAAGSIVSKSLPPYSISAGIPAKVIKYLH